MALYVYRTSGIYADETFLYISGPCPFDYKALAPGSQVSAAGDEVALACMRAARVRVTRDALE